MEKKHINILIIEDSLADRKLAELMLKESSVPSFGIRHAARLEEALKMLETEPCDIILMDLDLPDSSGLDGLKKIMDRPGSPPVVVLTGLEDEDMGLEALKKGASDFLVKGRLTLNNLIRSLLYALTRRDMEQKLLDEQHNLQAIFDAANVGMILLDETGGVQRINHVIQQWAGKKDATVYGGQPGNILGCIHALSDPAGCGHTVRCQACPIRKTFESVLNSGQPLHDIETETTLMIGSDQVHLHLAVSADPLVLGGKRHVILAMNNITARKQAEESLRRSREDLDRAQAVGQIGSWRLDTGRNILTWSIENHFIFGVPEGTPLTYETFIGSVHPEDRQYVDTCWKACLAGESYDIEHRIVVNGEVKWIRAKAYLEYDSEGKLLGGFGISQDITERKRIEEALRVSEERFRTMANAMPQLAWIARFDGYIFWYNQRWYQYTGTTPEQMEGWGWQSVHDPVQLPMVLERWKASLATGEPFEMTFPLRGSDGIFRPFLTRGFPLKDGAGRVVQWLGTNTDVGELKRIEEALATSELQYRRLFESAKDGILILDYKTGMIVDVNPFLIEMLGLSRETFLCKKVWELGFFSHIVANQDRFKALKEKDYIRYEDMPLETQDGRQMEVEFVSNVYQVGAHKVIQCNVRDITLRKQAEEILKRDVETLERIAQERAEELLETQHKLTQSKRLSDIGALAATVAHELRTPLGVIRIGAYNMKRKTEDPALLKHISHIETKVMEADKIISNLLLYSRIKMPSMEEVRLYDLLKECVDHAEENLKGHPIRIVSQFDPIKNESMKLDPLQIKEVFHNILANAADALAHRKDGQIKVSVLRHGSQGEISIIFEDNGIGISESDLKRIHEPFFTTKSKGTGLGLTVCTQIIQNHGGRIEVTSQIGQGSIFTVILPVGEGIVG